MAFGEPFGITSRRMPKLAALPPKRPISAGPRSFVSAQSAPRGIIGRIASGRDSLSESNDALSVAPRESRSSSLIRHTCWYSSRVTAR